MNSLNPLAIAKSLYAIYLPEDMVDESGDRGLDHVLEFVVPADDSLSLSFTHKNQEILESVEGKTDVSLAFIVKGIEIEIEMRRSNRTPTHQQ